MKNNLSHLVLATLVFLSLKPMYGQEAGEQATLKGINEILVQGKSDVNQTINEGVSLIKTGSSLEDEIRFLDLVAARGQLADFDRVYATLSQKYVADDSALIPLSVSASTDYELQLHDSGKAFNSLENARQLETKVDIAHALARLQEWNQMGENYYALADPAKVSEARQKAAEYYTRVVQFDSNVQPYFSQIRDFRTIQRNAASRLVEMSPLVDLPKLHLPIFFCIQSGQSDPEKAKLLGTPIELYKSQRLISGWLEGHLKDEPDDSPLKSHLQAVLDSVK